MRITMRSLAPLCLLIAALRSVTPTTVPQQPQQARRQSTVPTSQTLVYDPRLRHFRTPDNALPLKHSLQNYYRAPLPLPLPSPPSVYFLPQRAAPPELELYRNEGNFYRTIAPFRTSAPEHREMPLKSSQPQPQPPHHSESSPPALFDHSVLHVEAFNADERLRRYSPTPVTETESSYKPVSDSNATAFESKAGNSDGDAPKRYFHDIYMRYGGPPARRLAYGHVQSSPELLEKRFESLNVPAKRYRGEIVWADRTGGYGAHHWDMALGKL